MIMLLFRHVRQKERVSNLSKSILDSEVTNKASRLNELPETCFIKNWEIFIWREAWFEKHGWQAVSHKSTQALLGHWRVEKLRFLTNVTKSQFYSGFTWSWYDLVDLFLVDGPPRKRFCYISIGQYKIFLKGNIESSALLWLLVTQPRLWKGTNFFFNLHNSYRKVYLVSYQQPFKI